MKLLLKSKELRYMKKYVILLVIMYVSGSLFAQFADRQTNFPQISSPNVASFEKYIDHPISLYNGTPDVSIPLYTLKDGSIKLPIALRYNTSGIKVNEEASWVGLGWNLNVGGIISQNVMGYCDEEDTEYQNFLSTPEYQPFFESSQPFKGYWRLPYTLDIHKKIGPIIQKTGWYSTHGLGKLEPDVFYFSYPGNSGKFIIDYRTNQPYILSREQNLKIEILSNPKRFVITTPEGIKHTFNRMFDVIGDGIEAVAYGLVSSVYPNNQTVTYEYEIINNRSYSKYESYSTAYYGVNETTYPGYYGINGSPGYSSGDVNTKEGKEIVLKNIKTTNYDVSFLTDTRIDLPKNTPGKKLTEIKISSRDTQNHPENLRFTLSYDYFLADYAGSSWNTYSINSGIESLDWAGKRLKLISVCETSTTGKNDKYDFFYQETPLLPRKDSYAVDYWGYYNGQWSNKYLIPDLDMLLFNNPYYNKVLEAYYRGSFAKKYTGNRTYNFQYCKAAILTGVKYPTGGYMELEFEPNTFVELGALSWQQYMPSNTGGPTSVSNEYSFIPTNQEYYNNKVSGSVKDQNSPQVNSVFRFTIEEKCSAEITAILTNGNYTWQYLNQLTHFVYIKKINGTQKETILTIQMPLGSGSESKASSNLDLNPGTYELVADISDALGNILSGDYYYYATALSATISYPKPKSSYPLFSTGSGLRIKSISHFENKGDSKSLFSTSYEYNDPLTGKSSGILHDILNYVDVTKKLADIEIPHPSGATATTNFLYGPHVVDIYSNNTASNPYGNSSGVGYTYVKEIRRGGTDIGYTISKFKNESGYYRYRQGGAKVDMPLNGKLEEQSVYNDKGSLMEKNRYSYLVTPSNSYWSITFRDTKFTDLDKWVIPAHEWGVFYCYANSDELGTIGGDRILIYKTEIKSYDITMTNKESMRDGITTKEEYIYNSQTLQLKEKKIVIDANNNMRYSYTYPNDYNCGIYSTMTSKNMISNIIEEKIFRNDGYIGGYLALFRSSKDGNTIIPDKKYFAEVITQLTNPVTFSCSSGLNSIIYPSENILYKEYDSYGNPVYIIQEGSIQLVYLWSYGGQYPVAEIKNASYTDVNSALSSIGLTSIDALSANINPDKAKLANLRTLPLLSNALITTYTYKPLIGMLTSTDPSGITTYYDYDSFGRLKETYIYKDGIISPANKQIIQSYGYHYQNQ